MVEALSRLEGRTPRFAALLARAGARIRTNWFAAGAAIGVFLALSVVFIVDAGVAGGWWDELPPFSRPGSDPSFALWVWHNSGFLMERALVLLVSGLIGGLAGLVRGRRSRAWLPARVAEALDRLWGREYEFTSAVIALSENEVTLAAAALGVQVEQQLRARPPRSLRGLGLGIPGQGVLRTLGVVFVFLVGTSLASYWLGTHSPSRDTGKHEAVFQADSPLNSTFLALQRLADRLEEEARSPADSPLETDPPAAEGPLSEATKEEDEEKDAKDTAGGRDGGQGTKLAEADNQRRGEGQNPGGVTSGRPGRGYEEALLEATTSLRQAADLVVAGGQTAMPYARDLVLRAFNQLLQERVNLGLGAAGIDSLLQEMSSAARPLLAANQLARNLSTLTQAQGQGQAGARGQGQGTGQGQESRQAPGEPNTPAAHTGRSAGLPGQGPEPGGEPAQRAAQTDGPMTGPMTGPRGGQMIAEGRSQTPPGQYPLGTAGAAAMVTPSVAENRTSGRLPSSPEGSFDTSAGGSTGDPEALGEQANGVAAGTGRGSGASAQRLADPTELTLPSMPTGLLSGEIGQGPIWVTESGRLPQGVAVDEYGLAGQAEAADAGIERENVPLAYREWIRRYFGGL